ncbi:hypothetical protein Tco_0101820, partial [Tanacetum coccineum]
MDSGLVVPSFLPTDDPIASLNKAMAFISTTFALRYPPTNNQLGTSSNPRNQTTIQDGRVTVNYYIKSIKDTGERVDLGPDTQALTTIVIFQTDDLDAFDLDCDKAPSASVVLMAKLSAYDSDVLFEYSEQPIFVDNSDIDITSDNNVISYDQNLKENKSEVVQ